MAVKFFVIFTENEFFRKRNGILIQTAFETFNKFISNRTFLFYHKGDFGMSCLNQILGQEFRHTFIGNGRQKIRTGNIFFCTEKKVGFFTLLMLCINFGRWWKQARIGFLILASCLNDFPVLLYHNRRSEQYSLTLSGVGHRECSLER